MVDRGSVPTGELFTAREIVGLSGEPVRSGGEQQAANQTDCGKALKGRLADVVAGLELLGGAELIIRGGYHSPGQPHKDAKQDDGPDRYSESKTDGQAWA
jgi:hypothetical protein